MKLPNTFISTAKMAQVVLLVEKARKLEHWDLQVLGGCWGG
jgi:hypothetical protein